MAVPYDVLKRSLDIIVSFAVLVITLPMQAVIGVAIAIKLGRPVLFRQVRPGKHGQRFELVKFRTMKLPDPQSGLITDEDRMTAFGSKLRSTSLDELPTLWNVLRGDMSLVGPRPLLTSYLERYTSFQARRHEVRPGITGLAQVSGRNGVNWEERFRLDVEYVDHRSLVMDLRILFKTVTAVLARDGISADGHVTMPEFQQDGDSHE